jgi:elongator complex protein 1
MFSTFDLLLECSLHGKASKEFLTVGWGKKETQFHGSEGKDARRKKEIQIKDVEKLDKTISCCWRGDGEFFAVNYVSNENGRMFKVFNKEGSMEYASEMCENLQVPIAWKPSGLWIAKPEVLSDTYVISLFERNGLKHNKLVLPFMHEQEPVVNLCWNQDSDILLIETIRNDKIILYFYTICNYHWYLKHTIVNSHKVVYNWSQNYAEPKKLHLFDNNGNYSILKFDFVINHSSGASESDESIVAVIDGQKMLLTNFRSQMVPPPMSSAEIVYEDSINIVEFIDQPNEQFDSNSFATVNHRNQITLHRCIFADAINGKRLVEVEKVKTFYLNGIDGESITHIQWTSASKMLLSTSKHIFLYCIETGSCTKEMTLDQAAAGFIRINSSFYFVKNSHNLLNGFRIENDTFVSDDLITPLPEFCEKIIATTVNGELVFYGLKNLKKKLYMNAKEIATDVTSFTITNDHEFLIYTTIGELKFIKIDKSTDDVIETRRIERGSRIVSLVKNKAQIIFQLPRGNLETISPRILTLRIIRKHLAQSNYKITFDLLRKERINLNLLIDLQPKKFFNELETFIQQIDNINWLNLFLTELKNEDVTSTMYKFCVSTTDTFIENYSVDRKISFVCEKMLNLFIQLDNKKYLLPCITCHVKTENIESALQTIWELKKVSGNDKEADDAVKYLLYLIDINVLYNIALGMYDYHLVLYVAQKSQKDPKEYVPFLQELNKLEQSYAKFKIDCHLKRFAKAIHHIAPLCYDDEARFAECIEVVKKHGIYEEAMNAFVNHQKSYQTICKLFADYLRIKGKLLDASLMYERGADFQQALSSARNILDWKRCIMLAKLCNYDETQTKELALKLVQSLNDLSRFSESVDILRRFKEDKMLIETMLDGRMYTDALLEVSMTKNENLLHETFVPTLKQHVAEVLKNLNNDKISYLQQKERLLIVRQEKMKKIMNPQDDDDDDMFSDASSMNSQSSKNTAKTFKSAKNRRKHERKLLNMKEGSKFEDVALVDSLWRLVTKIIANETQNSIKEMVVTCVNLKLDEEAKSIQV